MEPIDPGGVNPNGEMGGEPPEVISGADPAPDGHFNGGDDDNADPPPLDAQPRARLSASDKLRVEAQSLEHKVFHLPKNPFCEACTMGKMKEKYSRRRTFKRDLTEWGEIITCDHIYSG